MKNNETPSNTSCPRAIHLLDDIEEIRVVSVSVLHLLVFHQHLLGRNFNMTTFLEKMTNKKRHNYTRMYIPSPPFLLSIPVTHNTTLRTKSLIHPHRHIHTHHKYVPITYTYIYIHTYIHTQIGRAHV